jgi:hypothetical protein
MFLYHVFISFLHLISLYYFLNIDKLTSLVDILTSLFEYIHIILRIHWHSLIESDKISSFASIEISNSFYRVRISKKKKLSFSKSKEKLFSQLFNFMKWSRLTSSLFLTSSVLVFRLSLFWYCLSSFSSFSFSWSFSLSVSFSFSHSFSVRDWISSMNNKRCL